MNKKITALLTAFVAVFVLSLSAYAAATIVVVTGDTAAGENQPGWLFNRDVATSTPFEFNGDEASIGSGSLYVEPITNTNNGRFDKFVSENFLATPVADVDSLAYDFLISGNGDSSDANQFYMNVYANVDDTSKFYDCRYDYVPTTGSTSEFTSFVVETTDTPTSVTRSSTARIASCPATLAEMPEGSYIRAFSISVGDTSTSLSDTGLAGYLDNVIVTTTNDVVTYDFEPALTPVSKNECKNGGWMNFNTPSFNNQGQCVSYVQANENAGK